MLFRKRKSIFGPTSTNIPTSRKWASAFCRNGQRADNSHFKPVEVRTYDSSVNSRGAYEGIRFRMAMISAVGGLHVGAAAVQSHRRLYRSRRNAGWCHRRGCTKAARTREIRPRWPRCVAAALQPVCTSTICAPQCHQTISQACALLMVLDFGNGQWSVQRPSVTISNRKAARSIRSSTSKDRDCWICVLRMLRLRHRVPVYR